MQALVFNNASSMNDRGIKPQIITYLFKKLQND